MDDDRKDLDKEFQQDRKEKHMADAEKNRKAWRQKATDESGRDWTKPRRFNLDEGQV